MSGSDLAGKRILVTGAGGGIGRAIVIMALARGASVLAVDLDENLLAETDELAHPRWRRVRIDGRCLLHRDNRRPGVAVGIQDRAAARTNCPGFPSKVGE